MRRIALFLFVFILHRSFGQFADQIPQKKKYKPAEVLDPTFGIKIYEKLNFALGGDSVRNDKKGYACQGFVEDFYENGQMVHKGYYVDGQLKVYRNFYENGQIERIFKVVDLKRTNMQLYYFDGKMKSEVDYGEGGAVIRQKDYFPNGQVEYEEEQHKSFVYILYRRSYFQNGKPESIFEITDPKKKYFSKKEYYENGNLKEEGEMHFNPQVIDYQKNGKWKTYNDSGKIMTEENYQDGEIMK